MNRSPFEVLVDVLMFIGRLAPDVIDVLRPILDQSTHPDAEALRALLGPDPLPNEQRIRDIAEGR